MDQTPVHEHHNPDLLSLMPTHARCVIEVGCSSGALAREYKKRNGQCRYVGIEISPEYAKLARRYCDSVLEVDVEHAGSDFFADASGCDCWVFGDSLEHLRDPWSLLGKIRRMIPDDGRVVACIPNAQHWSLQARLSFGDLRYEDSGLLDRTHLRWFTRSSMIEMFRAAGFGIEAGIPRIFDEPNREKFLPLIGAMAEAAGANRDMAIRDAIPLQYVLSAVPV
jgi:SAM-dependent methyltransferase